MRVALAAATVSLALAAAGCGSGHPSGALPPSSASVIVAPKLEGTRRPLPPDWLGVNGEAVTAPDGVWRSPGFVGAVAALAPEAIRVFGGTTANFWDWRRGTFVSRAPVVIPSELASARARVSIPLRDWARLVRAADATPVFDLNLVSSTLADQLAMLHAARALGMPITRVELGNELYLGRYAALFPDGATYGSVATQWASALKATFPGVRVAAVGFVSRGAAAPRSARERGWNAGVLSTLRGLDALAFHPYFRSGLQAHSSLRSARAVTAMLVQSSVRWTQVRFQVLSQLPRGMSAWLTEFNLFDRKAPVHTTWAQGLALGSYSLDELADPHVDQADVHALVASAPFGALFADRSGLAFGEDGQRSFRSPRASPPATQPYGRSATGVMLGALLTAMRGATSARQLGFVTQAPQRFAGAPALGLRGAAFGGGGALVLNLSPTAALVNTSGQLDARRFDQYWGSPATLVSGAGALHHARGSIAAAGVVAPAYSVTVLSH